MHANSLCPFNHTHTHGHIQYTHVLIFCLHSSLAHTPITHTESGHALLVFPLTHGNRFRCSSTPWLSGLTFHWKQITLSHSHTPSHTHTHAHTHTHPHTHAHAQTHAHTHTHTHSTPHIFTRFLSHPLSPVYPHFWPFSTLFLSHGCASFHLAHHPYHQFIYMQFFLFNPLNIKILILSFKGVIFRQITIHQ